MQLLTCMMYCYLILLLLICLYFLTGKGYRPFCERAALGLTDCNTRCTIPYVSILFIELLPRLLHNMKSIFLIDLFFYIQFFLNQLTILFLNFYWVKSMQVFCLYSLGNNITCSPMCLANDNVARCCATLPDMLCHVMRINCCLVNSWLCNRTFNFVYLYDKLRMPLDMEWISATAYSFHLKRNNFQFSIIRLRYRVVLYCNYNIRNPFGYMYSMKNEMFNKYIGSYEAKAM